MLPFTRLALGDGDGEEAAGVFNVGLSFAVVMRPWTPVEGGGEGDALRQAFCRARYAGIIRSDGVRQSRVVATWLLLPPPSRGRPCAHLLDN